MSNEIWRLEIVFKNGQAPRSYVMSSFDNVQEAINEANATLAKLDPETIETSKIVNYNLVAIGEIDPKNNKYSGAQIKSDPRYKSYQDFEGMIKDSILKMSGGKIDIDKYIPEQLKGKVIK